MYAVPGESNLDPIMWPSNAVATPMVDEVPVTGLYAETNICFWTSSLYPDPVFPIEIKVIAPNALIIAVAPAPIKGWYPRLWDVPAETIIPPLGILFLLLS